MDISKITTLVSSGISGIALQSLSEQKSNFEDTNNNLSTIQIIIYICVIFLILSLFGLSTYKLTGSYLQTFLSLFFGVFYIVIAYIYYGMSGYKLSKSK